MGTNAFNGLVFLTFTMPEFGLHQLAQTADLDAGITRISTCSAVSCCTPSNNCLIYLQGRSSMPSTGSDEAPRRRMTIHDDWQGLQRYVHQSDTLAGGASRWHLRAVEKGVSKQPHRTMGAG
ncbi:hypothetical protein ELI30_34875 [Rhizobium leguminosarum]|nr:hypothetical protein ELI31_34780 [Rhizobium leguminosarum]TAV41453.1 hypothetical protein ELI32_35010 [Rhizobium leguminosarum]TAV61190.1 hypothetical protein ELI30_34875 [Rhizobium leguminosarum]TAY62055.1 hypothetical protein ELH82_26425 [Rhizobium leguminosarum]